MRWRRGGANFARIGTYGRPILIKRGIIVPWLLSAVLMFVISCVWHGLLLNDISEMRMGLGAYAFFSGVAYLVIGLGLTLLVHAALARGSISLKAGFPFKGMFVGALAGIAVYLVVFLSGFSFASHELHHVALDLVWQIVEQALGGLMVSLGIIYDLHRRFMETERAH